MLQTRMLMGMPITVEIVDPAASQADFGAVFDYFHVVDARFSTYKDDSEITFINKGMIQLTQASVDMQTIFALAEQTKQQTDGYFEIVRNGFIDPSGIVKGWAIYNAAELLRQRGFTNFYVEAGGDIQAFGHNAHGQRWQVGIRNPFNPLEIVKVIAIAEGGVATSGTYVRGQHIYNPKASSSGMDEPITDIVSLTVIGPNIYDADRFATAAFAMGRTGIEFIEAVDGLEGYLIDSAGQATLTSGFERYVSHVQTH